MVSDSDCYADVRFASLNACTRAAKNAFMSMTSWSALDRPGRDFPRLVFCCGKPLYCFPPMSFKMTLMTVDD
jgi:hypothetical protein